MKLLYSATSPFVRKVSIVLIETGLSDRIENVPTNPWDPQSDLPAQNPIGKVPTLISRGDYEKKNDAKIAQILLYKEFFAKQFNVDVDQINVEYFILRRKINEDADFVARRVQEWRPASGKVKRGKAVKLLNEFVDNAFKDGDYNLEGNFAPTPSKSACMFCPYKEEKSLCSHAIT